MRRATAKNLILAFDAFADRMDALEAERHLSDVVPKWGKDKHLERIRESGRFRNRPYAALSQTNRYGPSTRSLSSETACSVTRSVKV